ncbi:ATP-dependent Clp protease ATP-binding subunit [Rhodococcus aerolatus]
MPAFFGPTGSGPAAFDGPGDGRRIDLARTLTAQSQAVMAEAARLATEHDHADLDSLHLLWAVLGDATAGSLVRRTGADTESLRAAVLEQLPGRSGAGVTAPALTTAARGTLLDAHRVARALGSTYVGPEHLLLALTASPVTAAGRLLSSRGVDPESVQAAGSRDEEPAAESATPTLDQYGTDLTALAREGRLDPVIGRAAEIEQTVEVLSRRTKNNPVLVGEAGVGKTAIAEGLAQRLVDGDVPAVLADRRLVRLELSSMLAGTRYRGDFEERLTKVVDEVVAHSGELLLFVDEVHTVVGAGGAEGAMDAGNILKPRLARGDLHLIGATTLDEYRRIEKDPALERRFQPVHVDEPSPEDATTILRGLVGRYAEHHQVHYTDEAVAAAVSLAVRYLPDRQLPDKAIDLLDQAGARRSLRDGGTDPRALEARREALEAEKDEAIAAEDYERASRLRDELAGLAVPGVREVTVDDVAEVVSRATGVPAARMTTQDKVRLARLEAELHERVVGQHEAVSAVARAVRRSRVGVADEGRPVGSFLFLGPTGVGKTELAKALAGSLFGDDDAVVRLDMSEFSERHNASRLVGAPPGYVGYEEAGQLTEAVRRRPYSVVLLDEVEKAHPDVFNTLLQVLDDGRLTDGQGRTVDFTNTVLIMTSNLGSEFINSRGGAIGFSTGDAAAAQRTSHEKVMGRVKESFRPEFLNRIDETVVFSRLEAGQLRTITELLLGRTRDRLAAKGIALEVSDAAVGWLAERGHQPELGARPLRRTIARELDDRVADLVVADELGEGGTARVDVVGGELVVTASAPVALAA